MKRCPACGESKDIGDFPRNRRSQDGAAVYCKECHNRKGRESRARNGGARRYHMRQRFGLEPEDVDRLVQRQGGLCAVCRRRPAVHVDHDHASGRVRGILCEPCNGGMGLFKDDPDLLRKAAAYLRRKPYPVQSRLW